MQYKVTCPSCNGIDAYSVPVECPKCKGSMGWASGNIQATFKGLECLDCRYRIWSIDCQTCSHEIPLIGKLAKFDGSDDPFLLRVYYWYRRWFTGARW